MFLRTFVCDCVTPVPRKNSTSVTRPNIFCFPNLDLSNELPVRVYKDLVRSLVVIDEMDIREIVYRDCLDLETN